MNLLETVSETGSTNADLVARIASRMPPPEGAWLIAQRQTAGRGRLGRAWEDGAGNLMASTLVWLRPGDPPPASLALMAGLAVRGAVADFVTTPQVVQLKWPNDVMVGGAKLAGILLERVGDHIVIGIGINCAGAPPLADRETAALADFGPPPAIADLAATLAAEFAAELSRWRGDGLAVLLARWQAAAHPPGTPLTVHAGSEALAGSFAGLAPDGALRLALAGGTTRTIHAGDVTLG